MLKLYLGEDHKETCARIYGDILRRAEAGNPGSILIVPEQYSFSAEWELCRRGGSKISRFAEVLSFSRLAGRTEALYGGGARPSLDRGGRLLAAACAVDAARSRLKLYAGASTRPEFLKQLLAAFDEFGGYGVLPEDLKRLSGERFEGQFAQKLEELSLLYESYLTVTAQRQDATRRLERLKERLESGEYQQERAFFVFGFSDLTALELGVLQELARFANVEIALETTYSAVQEQVRSWAAFCAENRIELEKETVPSRENGVEPSVRLAQKRICGEEVPKTERGGSVQTALFGGTEEMLRFAAKRACELFKGGARADEIAVVCPDSALVGEVSRVFGLCGIHTDVTEKISLDRHSGVRCILLALYAATDGWDRDILCDYLHSILMPENDSRYDRLENYARLWNIRGKLWEKPFDRNPSGLRERPSEGDERRLAETEALRGEVMAPLIALRDGIKNAADVRGMVTALYDYLQRVGYREALQRESDRLFDAGKLREAQQFVQIYELVLNAMEQTALILGDCKRTPDGFYRTIQMLLEQYGVGTVPATKNSISVGAIGSVRCGEVRHLILLGAENGVFPTAAQGGSVFTEQERKHLLQCGVTLAPLLSETVERELSLIRQAFFAATDSILIAARDGSASYLFYQLHKVFPKADTVCGTIVLNDGEYAAARLRAGTAPEDETMQKLAEKAGYRFGNLSEQSVRALYGETYRFSATQVDLLAGCRFAYFLRYGLHLKADKPVTFDALQFGQFVHSVLENTARQVMEEGGFAAVSAERVTQLAEENAASYVQFLAAQFGQEDCKWDATIARDTREAVAVANDVADELRISEFAPEAFEFSFGSEEGCRMGAISAAGKTASCEMRGFVDRLDLFRHGGETYVRVVDYKSGEKKLKYDELLDGVGMQMLIYLFALKQNGASVFGSELKPAGAMYLPALDPIISVGSMPKADTVAAEAEKKRKEKKRRNGILLMNPTVLAAMEQTEGATQYLPAKLDKDGKNEDCLLDAASFARLERFIFRKLGELADTVKSGEIAPNPIYHNAAKNTCLYCDYRDICQRDFTEHETRYRKEIKQNVFMETLEKQEAEA